MTVTLDGPALVVAGAAPATPRGPTLRNSAVVHLLDNDRMGFGLRVEYAPGSSVPQSVDPCATDAAPGTEAPSPYYVDVQPTLAFVDVISSTYGAAAYPWTDWAAAQLDVVVGSQLEADFVAGVYGPDPAAGSAGTTVSSLSALAAADSGTQGNATPLSRVRKMIHVPPALLDAWTHQQMIHSAPGTPLALSPAENLVVSGPGYIPSGWAATSSPISAPVMVTSLVDVWLGPVTTYLVDEGRRYDTGSGVHDNVQIWRSQRYIAASFDTRIAPLHFTCSICSADDTCA